MKEKLEEINYIGGEESYIDIFLFGPKTDLTVGVRRYKCKPRTLYGAFRRAEMEENVNSEKEFSTPFIEIPSQTLTECKEDVCPSIQYTRQVEGKENYHCELQFRTLIEEDLSNHEGGRVPGHMFDEFLHGKPYNILVVRVCESEDKSYKVFEEMSHPNSIKIADIIRVESVSDDDSYIVVDAFGDMATKEGSSSMLDTKKLLGPGMVIEGDKVLGMFKPACAGEVISFSLRLGFTHLLNELGLGTSSFVEFRRFKGCPTTV